MRARIWPIVTLTVGMAALAMGAFAFLVLQRAPGGVPEFVLPLGHAGEVNALAWSPDGKTLASGSADATAKLWDPATGILLRTIGNHDQEVVFTGWSADGRELATDGPNRGISLWNVQTGALVRTVAENHDTIMKLAWSPDRTKFAAVVRVKMGSRSVALVRIWRADTGTTIATVGDDAEALRDVAWSPDSKLVAAVGSSLKIYQGDSGVLFRALRTETRDNVFFQVAFSPDGKTLGESAGSLNLWNVETGVIQAHHRSKEHYIASFAWSPDGKMLATGGMKDIELRRADSSGKEMDLLRTFHGQTKCVCELAWSPDGQTIAAGSEGGIVNLWQVASGTLARSLPGQPNSIYSLAWSPDGRAIASGSEDHKVRIWNAASGTMVRSLSGHSGGVYSLAWSPDSRLIASGSRDRTARIWDANSGTLLHRLAGKESGVPEQLGYSGPHTVVLAWRPDGKTLAAVGFDDNNVKFWQVASGKLRRNLNTPQQGIYSLSWSPDGRALAAGSGYIQIWRGDSGALLAEQFQRQTEAARLVAYSPDGKTFASVGFEAAIDLLSVASLAGSDRVNLTRELQGKEVAAPAIQRQTIPFPIKARAAAWSPDGTVLATGHDDGTIRLWRGDNGTAVRSFARHQGFVEAVTWSPDGRRLASGGEDATLRIWNVATGELESVTTQLQGDEWMTQLPKNLLYSSSAQGDEFAEVQFGFHARQRFPLASEVYRSRLKKPDVRSLLAQPRPDLRPDYQKIAGELLHQNTKPAWIWLGWYVLATVLVLVLPAGARWLVAGSSVVAGVAAVFYFALVLAAPKAPANVPSAPPAAPPVSVTQTAPAPEPPLPPKVNQRDGLRYVRVPAGAFQMGCSSDDTQCPGETSYGGLHDEGHGFLVTITKAYWMGETPVTVGAYKRFSEATGRPMPEEPYTFTKWNPGWQDEQLPMVDVNWFDAKEYCTWAGMRLPTEAEWERAARGGLNTPRYGEIDDIAWHTLNIGQEDGAKHVGLKQPNAYGLYDMLGNVREWTADWWGLDYYEKGPRQDPQGPESGDERILRGSSWHSDSPVYIRASTRYSYRPRERQGTIGFRCAGN